MSAADLQAFLRFLSQDAKVPLAMAMSQVKELQKASLDSPEKLAKAKAADLGSMFPDEKVAKQIVAAAKRVAKKRAAGEAVTPSARKKPKTESLFSEDVVSPAELEASVALPTSSEDADELARCVLFTNRAPLVLAFAVTLLKHTMPEQPPSSRLSLAQAYVSTTSRARAVNLGIESGRSAEEEGFGEGQPLVTVMGKQLRVLRRWGYKWKDVEGDEGVQAQQAPDGESQVAVKAEKEDESSREADDVNEEKPALWALDLEALKKSNTTGPIVSDTQSGNHNNLPIYTPQSARAYLLKSFGSAPSGANETSKKISAAAKMAEKDRNLGRLLRVLDLLYESWAGSLGPEVLDKRTWSWYVKVRPDVENGVAGWGGKNEVKLADILALRSEANGG